MPPCRAASGEPLIGIGGRGANLWKRRAVRSVSPDAATTSHAALGRSVPSPRRGLALEGAWTPSRAVPHRATPPDFLDPPSVPESGGLDADDPGIFFLTPTPAPAHPFPSVQTPEAAAPAIGVAH
jgi:hypothetical protein